MNNIPEFLPILNANLSDKERQAIFLQAYRAAELTDKTITKVCKNIGLPRSEFNLWLGSDPEFEAQYWGELSSLAYSLAEELATTSAQLLEDGNTISKSRFYSLQIASKGVEIMLGKLNKERFSDTQNINLKNEGMVIPSINISLISADIPSISQAYQASIANDKAITIDAKKEAIEAHIIESNKID